MAQSCPWKLHGPTRQTKDGYSYTEKHKKTGATRSGKYVKSRYKSGNNKGKTYMKHVKGRGW